MPREALAARSRAWAGVTILTAAAALGYVLFGLIRFRRFRDGTFDLVIFDQAVRGYAHFHAPASMARGVADGTSTHFLVLGDHWSPILAVLAPLYWIHDGPATLIVAQALLFALAIPPLWIYTRRLLGARAAYFVCGAYALSLPIAAALNFDFHEVAFVPVLTAVMAERFQAGRRLQGVLAAVALLMVKEDMGLLVAGYGAYLFLIRQRRIGLSFIVGGLAATWLSTRVLIPAFGGSATFYWAYGQLGSTVLSAGWHVVIHPLQTLGMLVTPRVKVITLLSLLAPLGFLPLASPMAVAVVPLLLERMLATGYPAWWGTSYHYDAFIVMILVLAAVDGAARTERLIRARWPWLQIPAPRVPALRIRQLRTTELRFPALRFPALRFPALRIPALRVMGATQRPGQGTARTVPIASAWAVAVCVAAVAALPFSPLGQLLHPKFYTVNARVRAANAAAAEVPDGALVEATDYVGPHLSGRAQVLLLDGTPRWAPWVVADTLGLDFPFCSPADQARYVTYLEASGYTQVFARDGFVVLRRPADERTQAALLHPVPSTRLRGNLCPRYQP
jgi:uncharacterized membrane protein